ncbi:MAG TPA: exosortase/archaeosortase family protein [Phycisphaeraceae bacterium]
MGLSLPGRRVRSVWNRWRLTSGLALVCLGLAVTYRPWLDMIDVALTNPDARYILLVPAVSAWLIWVRRQRLRLCQPRGTMIGPAVALAGWLMLYLGAQNGLTSLWHAGGLVVVLGCVLAVVGWDAAKRFLPALVILVLLIPPPLALRQRLAQPLHEFTLDLTWTVWRLLGISVERSGGVLSVGGTEVAVSEATGGLPMVLALFLVTYALAFGKPLRASVRGVLLLLTPLTVVLCGMVGVLVTVWAFGHYPQQGAYHLLEFSRWCALAAALMVSLGALRLLVWASVPVGYYTLAQD